MDWIQSGLASLAERAPLPDFLIRAGIAARVARTNRMLSARDSSEATARFAAAMEDRPIAEHTEAANRQHYALPPEFFELVLGPRRKYSCCLYRDAAADLARAEEDALAATAANAAVEDGQRILDLGCGWGSMSLWLAENLPRSRILAVSNSEPQRRYIEYRAAERGLGNLEVVTADANRFEPGARFDRILSIEMFEHLANWPSMFARMRSWLARDGRALIHVFCHRAVPYRFDHADGGDWIARHFFTGGQMPSRDLVARSCRGFDVEAQWWWSGLHYRRTALDWLANFDRNRDAVAGILESVYGREVGLWVNRWRLFFLATAGLFGAGGGNAWGVGHYRLKPG